jgi:hypothetical protein
MLPESGHRHKGIRCQITEDRGQKSENTEPKSVGHFADPHFSGYGRPHYQTFKPRTAEYRRKRKLHHLKFLVRYSICNKGEPVALS